MLRRKREMGEKVLLEEVGLERGEKGGNRWGMGVVRGRVLETGDSEVGGLTFELTHE